jgi:hypothetical protein
MVVSLWSLTSKSSIRFGSSVVYMEYFVVKMPVGPVILRVLRYLPLSIILSALHTHLIHLPPTAHRSGN